MVSKNSLFVLLALLLGLSMVIMSIIAPQPVPVTLTKVRMAYFTQDDNPVGHRSDVFTLNHLHTYYLMLLGRGTAKGRCLLSISLYLGESDTKKVIDFLFYNVVYGRDAQANPYLLNKFRLENASSNEYVLGVYQQHEGFTGEVYVVLQESVMQSIIGLPQDAFFFSGWVTTILSGVYLAIYSRFRKVEGMDSPIKNQQQ